MDKEILPQEREQIIYWRCLTSMLIVQQDVRSLKRTGEIFRDAVVLPEAIKTGLLSKKCNYTTASTL